MDEVIQILENVVKWKHFEARVHFKMNIAHATHDNYNELNALLSISHCLVVWENIVHFSPNCDQLDDLVILPMFTGLHNIHLFLHIFQLNDFRVFLNYYSSFCRFQLLRITLRHVALLKDKREIYKSTRTAWLAGENSIPGKKCMKYCGKKLEFEHHDMKNFKKVAQVKWYFLVDGI